MFEVKKGKWMLKISICFLSYFIYNLFERKEFIIYIKKGKVLNKLYGDFREIF